MPDYAALIIAVCWLVAAGYWLVSGFFAKRAAQKAGWTWPVVAFRGFVVVITVLASTGLLAQVTGPALYDKTRAIGLAASVIAMAGLGLMVWARTVLGRNWSGDISLKEEHDLIRRGPYAVIQHPIYSGLLLLILGTVILHGHLLGFLAWILFMISLVIKSLREEKLLAQHFPQAYPEYHARVKRFIPFVV